MNTHEDLDVWKKSVMFVKTVYQVTGDFPDTEKYGLVSQIRRAAVSIPSNIAEGASRRSRKEFIQFLYIARGSLSEAETLILISKELNMLGTDTYKEMRLTAGNIGRMLTGLIRFLRTKSSSSH